MQLFILCSTVCTICDYRSIYVECMGKTVFNLFKNYTSQLLKLDSTIATKADTIAIEESALKSIVFMPTSTSMKV